MLEWLLLTTGGAAIYAASKLLRFTRRSAAKASQQTTGKVGQPLKLVVAQCEARWFLQDLKLAMSGDAEAMVRVSHMLMAGYGTKQDHAAAAAWMRQAWAIQNYKEPAMLHNMLDVRGSDIPALNDAVDRQATHAAHSISSTQSSSSSSSNGSAGVDGASGRLNAAGATASTSVGHGSSSKQSGCREPGGAQQLVSYCSSSGTAEGAHSTDASFGGSQQPWQQQQQHENSHQASSCVAHLEVQSQQQQQQQQQQGQQAALPLQQTSRLKKQRIQRAGRTVQLQRVAAAVLASAGHQPVAAGTGAKAITACYAVG